MGKINKEKKIYMIRRLTDGLYSSGNTYPTFSEKGKMWTTTSALNGHINNLFKSKGILGYDKSFHPDKFYDATNPYRDCEIVSAKIEAEHIANAFEYFSERYMKKIKKE